MSPVLSLTLGIIVGYFFAMWQVRRAIRKAAITTLNKAIDAANAETVHIPTEPANPDECTSSSWGGHSIAYQAGRKCIYCGHRKP